MSWSVIIMFAVAALLSLIGAGLLAALTATRSPGKVYAFRMVGIMTLSGGIVLGVSAWVMWQGTGV